MGDAAAAAAAALEWAQQDVSRNCDSLLSRQPISMFDETLGSKGYAPWRRELCQAIEAVGADFMAALVTDQIIPTGALYNDASVLLDTVASVPVLTMPQRRQHAILATIRSGLSPLGESLRLIEGCRHAGGRVQSVAGIISDQAIKILDQRWYGGPAEVNVGAETRALYAQTFPTTFSVDAWNMLVNKTQTLASKIGLNPPTENISDQVLRQQWWNLFAEPPASIIYYSAA